MKPTSLINPNLPTVTMPGMNPLIRFLAKVQKGIPSVLRYGNRTQAEVKRESLAARIMQEDSKSACVQVESRFLIAIFPAKYDLDQKTGELIRRILRTRVVVGWDAVAADQKASRRPPFATVSGLRTNPRNRHNQHLPDDGPGPVYCGQPVPVSDSDSGLGHSILKGRPMSRRDQYRAASDRLNGRGQ